MRSVDAWCEIEGGGAACFFFWCGILHMPEIVASCDTALSRVHCTQPWAVLPSHVAIAAVACLVITL